MKNIVTLIQLFLFFFASTQSLRATTYYVDANRPDNTGAGTSWATAKKDVQDAINLASAGDQVWVKAGTYTPTQYPAGCSGCSTARDYTFFVKDGVKLYGGFAGAETTLTQRNIAANTTTLSGEIGNLTDTTDNSYHIVMAVAPSTGGIGVTVDGFTIRRAYATTTTSVTINGLSIYRYQGGGIWLGGGTNTISNNTITRNTVTNFGGGIYTASGTHTITQNTIFTNRAYSGGGIYSTSSNISIYSSTIYGNIGYTGGGIYLASGTDVVRDNTLYSNTATSSGGGMYIDGYTSTISNNVLYKNKAAVKAGGIHLNGGATEFLSNTIVGNEVVSTASSGGGGGIYLSSYENPIIKNCIFWNNKTASNSNDISSSPQNTIVSYCLTQVGSPFSTGVGIINNQDPLFVDINDIDGPDNIHRTADDGLNLQYLSPCVDEGIMDVGIPTTDILGATRPQYGVPDIGAYEQNAGCAGFRAYVDAARPDNSGDGLSWATAKKDIQAAINISDMCEIWVKAGTYKPTQEPDGTTDTPRDFTFYLQGSVRIYGGFAGTETSHTQRNINTNPTILSGDIGALNNNTDNTYHVVVANNPDNNNRVIVDGFHITGGNANDAGNLVLNGTNIPRGNGGGVCILNGTNIIRNNTLTNNSCSRLGGGIYALSGVHTITQNELSNNTASTRGGGIYSENATVTIHNNTIQSNSASVRGGGVYVKNNTSTITNNTVISNIGSLRGGGIYTEATVSTLGNNVLKSNTAEYGGGIYTEVSTNTILNNTIVQNSSSAKGGGLYTYQGSNLVKTCLFWDNAIGTATNVLGADIAEYVSSNTITYCLTQQNSLYSSGVGIVNNQDPLFSNIADIDGADNTHRTADDGLMLSCATQALSMQVSGIELSTDILGIVRSQRVGVSYGAYELGSCLFYVDASRPDNTGVGTSWATAKKDVQDAINLALAGDQVWVKAGTYKPTQYPAGCTGCSTARNYTFFVKDGVKLYGGFAGTETTLTQRNIAANTTTLSGEIGNLTDTTDNSYHIVMAVAPITGSIGVTVDGFTIRGAYATTTTSFTINGLSIYRNQGGGVWLGGGTNTISNNTITRNTVTGFGGAIHTAYGIKNIITQNTIFANHASLGGGIYSYINTTDIYNNTIYGNTGSAGGGIYLEYGTDVVKNNTLYGNTATGNGGGLCLVAETNATISNNILYKNKATSSAGGIYIHNGTNQILNNTIVGNEVTASSGGIYAIGSGTTIKNSIFWNNKVVSNSNDIGGTPTIVSHCLTQAGSPFSTGVGIINNQDPLFVDINDIDGPDNIHRTADDGLNLQYVSPCLDKGIMDVGVPTTDILGTLRPQYGVPDIGAYEQSAECSNGLRVYVDAARPDNSGDGLSWATAKKDIQVAINTANMCGQVWVKAGTYKPTQEPDGTIDTPRDFAFYLQGSVGIYGGFAGTETTLGQRNIMTNVTTLSGDIGVANSNTDNAYHVVVVNSLGNSTQATVDGFHITGGNANDASNLVLNGTNIPRGNGGGICILNGTNTIRNNTLDNNSCSRLGGGIYALSGVHTITQNEISNNTASTRGGGIYSENASVTIHNNTIQSNTASVRGGGVYAKSGTSTITNNTIIHNTGSLRGGGIYTEATVSTLGNNVLKSNTAQYGGGIYTEVGTNTILNSTIVQNISSVKGGGLYTYQGSNVVKNCLFWDNAIGTTINVLGADVAEYASSNTVTYSLTQQNSLYSSGVGVVNNQDPLFADIADIDGVDNIHRTADDGLVLSCATSAWNQQGLDVGLSTDILGLARAQRVGLRYGAYESLVGGCSFYVDASRPDNTGAGTSWATAKKDVQDAMNMAFAGDQVWVKAGTYKPTQYPAGCSGCMDARDYTFFVKDGVKLYGGFAGTETSLAQRNIAANTTTLSGEVGNLIDTTDNSYHIIMAVAPTSNGIGVTVDGFTIRDAYAATTSFVTVNGLSIYRNIGGGIWLGVGTNTISNNTITRNTVTGLGGGVYASFGAHTITQNTIFANRAYEGGGVHSTNSTSDVSNNTLYDNTGHLGGGIYLGSGTDMVRNNTLYGNTATKNGGGLFLLAEINAAISNNILYKNEAAIDGGGIYLRSGKNRIFNNTIVGNEVTSSANNHGGGGIYISGINTIIKNSIFWDNKAGSNSNDIVVDEVQSSVNISHCLTQAGSPFSTGLGIINNQAPLFVDNNDIDGPDNLHRTPDDGLRLLFESPAVNSGIMDIGVPTTDVISVPRPQSTLPDMGAYEWTDYCLDGRVFYVNATRPNDTGDGLSWATAKKSLQGAIDVASCGDKIWVKAGVYKPTVEADGTTDSPRDFAFYIKNSIHLYGGFAGTETSLDQRSFNTQLTTLTGDIGTANNTSDNTYHVVVVAPANDSVRVTIDGFRIKSGNANDPSNITFNGQVIQRNNGGGIFAVNGKHTFKNNRIFGNTASRFGGAIYANSGEHTIQNNIISTNTASTRGGGIYTEDGTYTLTNNVIATNTASVRGGGVYTHSGMNNIINNTIVGNISATKGGGLYTHEGMNTIQNTIFWNNKVGTSATVSGADIAAYASTNTVSYCLTQQNSDYSTGIGIVNNQDPLFLNELDIDGPDNLYYTVDDGLYLQGSSPSSNAGEVGLTPIEDILGNPRNQAAGIDMGAYEGICSVLGANVLYVDAAVTLLGNGMTWATAYKTLSDALAHAHNCPGIDTIKVAAGTYIPTRKPFANGTEMITSDERDKTFHLSQGLVLLGGYPSGGGATRLPETYKTILSGDIGVPQDSSDNCYHVVYVVGTTVGVVFDGFRVTQGNASRLYQDLPYHHTTRGSGGGMYFGAHGTPSQISNNVFYKNRAAGYGGAINLVGASLKAVSNNVFIENSAVDEGGALAISVGGCYVFNNVIANNRALVGGGVNVRWSGTRAILYNNTILQNFGGGVYFVSSTSGVVANCIVLDGVSEGPWCNDEYDDYGYYDCVDIQYYTNLIGLDPQFVNINDLDGPDDKFRTADDGLRLLPCSPAINTGTNAQATMATDITGAPRIQEGTVDIGAYESSSLAAYAVRTDELTANATCLDGEWTHYVNTTENALLLSVKKNGNDIGSIGDGTLRVTAGGTGASRLTADDNAQENWYRTNRHWSISATHPPQTDMSVRFYYRTEDADALMNMAGISDESYMVFYTAADGSAELMERGEAGKSVDIYTRGEEASTSQWLWGISPDADSHSYAEMVVAPFEKDIDGAGAAIRKVAPFLPKDIELYPNPSRGLVQVTGVDLGSTSVTVRNVLGQEQAWVRDGNALNLSELPAGVYFIEFAGRAGAYQIVKE